MAKTKVEVEIEESLKYMEILAFKCFFWAKEDHIKKNYHKFQGRPRSKHSEEIRW